MRISTRRVLCRVAAVAAVGVVLSGWSTLPAEAQRTQPLGRLAGTWYLALDLTVIGLPAGATLPAVASFHRDGTFNISDPGDLASAPFTELDTTQYGSWVRTSSRTFEATTLFLRKAASGELEGWHRVRFSLQFGEDFDHLEGLVTEEMLPCPSDGPTPFALFNCPDPMTATFIPTPWEIPISGTRLKARG